MTSPVVRLRRAIPLLVAAVCAAVVAAPAAFGFSAGIMDGGTPAPPADFATIGCTACHGPGPAGHHDFAAGGTERVQYSIVDAEGAPLAGNTYEADGAYTITITLNETNAPNAANHAGFNLRASAGKLAAVDGVSQVNGLGNQATHTGAGRATWQVEWTAPADGPAVFDLFVNDVDGSSAPDAGDRVYSVGWFLKGHDHATPGTVAEHEVHYGISLQQYWIGLIGLAGMLAVMVAGFVYLKFVNPHNTDQKDR